LDGIAQEDEKKRTELASNITESVRNVIGNLRETIWAINDETISISDFSDRLKVYVRMMFRNTETKIEFTEQIREDIKVNSVTGLNLYRICQEIINNAFKHAGAGLLKVDLNVRDRITVVIQDDGKGFDPEKLSEEGFGLSNIKARAAEAGISLDLKTGIREGVTYTLIV
jgi:signal transduction histidine kinase